MEEIKVSEMLQADSINKDDSVMIIQEGVNKKASGSIQTATGTSLSLTSVADTCKVTSNSKNMLDSSTFIIGDYATASATIRTITSQTLYLRAGTYTISTNLDLNTYRYYVLTTSTPIRTAGITQIYNSNWQTSATFTFTINSSQEGYFSFTTGKIDDSTITSQEMASYNFQLEEGSTATEYNPYITEVTLSNGTDSQSIVLTPQEEKTAFTYDIETTLTSNGSVTIEYNTQSRLLNNDDTTAIKEYVDREIDNRKSGYASYSGTTSTLQQITGTTATTITNMSVNINTTGKPLFVATSFFAKTANASYSALAKVYVDGVEKVGRLNTIISTSDIPYTGMVLLENISAGNHTIEIKIAGENANSNITLPTWYTRYLNVWEIN